MDKILKLESVYFANKSIKAEEKNLTTYQPLHWHDFYEIEYIIDGGGEYIINGNRNEIKSGALFFSTPSDIHEIVFKRSTHLLNISFTSHYIDDKLLNTVLSAFVSDDTDGSDLFMLKNILSRVDKNIKNRTLYLKSMLSALLVTIANKGKPIDTNHSHIAAHKSLREIIAYINKHFNEPIDLNILASLTNLTPKYLSKRFIELSGMPLSQYIQEVRLNYAKNLVVTTDIPIKQICFQSGFNTLPHFSRSFKAKYRLAPSQMRNIKNKAKSSSDNIR